MGTSKQGLDDEHRLSHSIDRKSLQVINSTKATKDAAWEYVSSFLEWSDVVSDDAEGWLDEDPEVSLREDEVNGNIYSAVVFVSWVEFDSGGGCADMPRSNHRSNLYNVVIDLSSGEIEVTVRLT